MPDYVTHVEEGGFYGWPWYYLGAHQDLNCSRGVPPESLSPLANGVTRIPRRICERKKSATCYLAISYGNKQVHLDCTPALAVNNRIEGYMRMNGEAKISKGKK